MNASTPGAHLECAVDACPRKPMADSPVPLCGRHVGLTYEFARDLLVAAKKLPEPEPPDLAAEMSILRSLFGVGEQDPPYARLAGAVSARYSTLAGRRLDWVRTWLGGLDVTPEFYRAIVAQADIDVEKRADTATTTCRAEAPASGEVVYYLRFGDRIKIGYSSNLATRLTVIPHDEVLATEPGTRETEQQRHRQFSDLRLTGEWFSMGAELIGHIETIRGRTIHV